MRHVVVLGQLLGEMRLARAGFARQRYLKRLQATLFAELLFDKLDVVGQATLAVPLELAFARLFTLCRFFADE